MDQSDHRRVLCGGTSGKVRRFARSALCPSSSRTPASTTSVFGCGVRPQSSKSDHGWLRERHFLARETRRPTQNGVAVIVLLTVNQHDDRADKGGGETIRSRIGGCYVVAAGTRNEMSAACEPRFGGIATAGSLSATTISSETSGTHY
jgi:hypothetical protein